MNGIIYWKFDPKRGDNQVGIYNLYYTGSDGAITAELAVIKSTGLTSSGDLVGQASQRRNMSVANGRITNAGIQADGVDDYAISPEYVNGLFVGNAIEGSIVSPVIGQVIT